MLAFSTKEVCVCNNWTNKTLPITNSLGTQLTVFKAMVIRAFGASTCPAHSGDGVVVCSRVQAPEVAHGVDLSYLAASRTLVFK